MTKKKHFVSGHISDGNTSEELRNALCYLDDTEFIEKFDVLYSVEECEYCGIYIDIEANLTDEEVAEIIAHYKSL